MFFHVKRINEKSVDFYLKLLSEMFSGDMLSIRAHKLFVKECGEEIVHLYFVTVKIKSHFHYLCNFNFLKRSIEN